MPLRTWLAVLDPPVSACDRLTAAQRAWLVDAARYRALHQRLQRERDEYFATIESSAQVEDAEARRTREFWARHAAELPSVLTFLPRRREPR